jgi:hypothetical protein
MERVGRALMSGCLVEEQTYAVSSEERERRIPPGSRSLRCLTEIDGRFENLKRNENRTWCNVDRPTQINI